MSTVSCCGRQRTAAASGSKCRLVPFRSRASQIRRRGIAAPASLSCSPEHGVMFRDTRDPALAPPEPAYQPAETRRTAASSAAPAAGREDDLGEHTLVAAKSNATTDAPSESESDRLGAQLPHAATRTISWAHHPIFAEKARGIRTRALRFVSRDTIPFVQRGLQRLKPLPRPQTSSWFSVTMVKPPEPLPRGATLPRTSRAEPLLSLTRAPASSIRSCLTCHGSRPTPRSEGSAACSSSSTWSSLPLSPF